MSHGTRRLPSSMQKFVAFAAVALIAGCSDLGEAPRVPVVPDPEPAIRELVPHRTVRGDTLRIEGQEFGAAPGASRILFPSALGEREVAPVAWSNESVTALVPTDMVDGDVRLDIDGEFTNALPFSVADSTISLREDLLPIFETFTCLICHGTSNPGGGFRISDSSLQIDYAAMISTGTTPPNVVPRRSPQSKVLLRLLPAAADLRMPQDQFPRYLNEDEIGLVADWIDQGALDN